MHVMKPSRASTPKGDGTFDVTVTPPAFTGASASTINLTADQFARYEQWRENGGLIQHIMYDLNDNQREILMSGLGEKDFDRVAGKDD